MNESISIRAWGRYALFSRCDLKVERLTYPTMTPSAARGILDAILFKPQMRWHVRRITMIRPPGEPETDHDCHRYVMFRRNEIQDKIAARTVTAWMADPSTFEPYYVDSAGRESAFGANRTQRNSMALADVAYQIDATPLLTTRANLSRQKPLGEDEPDGPDSVAKYVAMFQRRVAKGQCFHRPYFGCREFECHFAAPDGSEVAVDRSEDLGFMLYDIDFGPNGQNTPGFFQAQIKKGVLHCDTLAQGPNGEPPVKVCGWSEVEKRRNAS